MDKSQFYSKNGDIFQMMKFLTAIFSKRDILFEFILRIFLNRKRSLMWTISLIYVLLIPYCDQPTRNIDDDYYLIFEDTDPSWSPDGRWIAYTHFSNDTTHPSGIYIVDTSGTEVIPLLRGCSNPDWSPDGDFIAFEFSRNVYIAQMDSTEKITQLTFNWHSFEPSVSPDGEWIAFNISVTNPGYDTSGLNVINKDGNNRRWIVGGCQHDYAPDGLKFTFARGVSVKPGISHAEIFISDINGGNITQLTDNGYDTGMRGYSSGVLDNTQPSWSPDGNFITWQHDWEVWIMNSDGSAQKKLTNGERPSWSPDSKKIVFSRYVNEYNALFIMDKNGNNVKQITNPNIYQKK